jgi:hypothetical protein
MRLKSPTGYTKDEYRAQQEANYSELQKAVKGEPYVPKTILDVQHLAQKFLEDEILQYELHLFNDKERRSEKSETIKGLKGYLMYLYDQFDDGHYSEIQKTIYDYTDNEKIDKKSAYYKILEKYFVKARIDSLNIMIDLYFGKSYKYTINENDLNTTIDDYGKNNTLKKLLLSRNWTNDKTKARQKNVDYLIKVIKNEYSSANKEYNKDQIAWQIYERMEYPTSYDNIRKNYMIGWKEI